MVCIILFGLPGSGKGTQANFISEKYNIPHISTGNILRDMAKKKSKTFNGSIKKYINYGNLVKDKLVIELVKNRISQNDCKRGFILDGFPRTLSQVNALKINNIKINIVLEIIIPNDLITDRIIGRKIHESSGRIYHTKFNIPKYIDKDDITGESLITREDDVLQSVQNRLTEYQRMTLPVINYYKKEANIGNIQYYSIEGTKKIEEISKEISTILDTSLNIINS